MDKFTRHYSREDVSQIQKWLLDRGLPTIPDEYLPPTGIIVDGIAVGFILFTNTSVGIFDYFISNPKVGPKDRREAIFNIAEGLLLLAQASGCKAIKCSTRIEPIENIAMHFGFKETGTFKSFFKEL